MVAGLVGAVAIMRRSYDNDPERKARIQEKDLHSLAEKISK